MQDKGQTAAAGGGRRLGSPWPKWGSTAKLIALHKLNLDENELEVVSNLRTRRRRRRQTLRGRLRSAPSSAATCSTRTGNTWSSYPEDALKNPHSGIADVELGDLDGDGKLKMYVSYWGVVGVQAASLEGKRLWSNRSLANVIGMAIGARRREGTPRSVLHQQHRLAGRPGRRRASAEAKSAVRDRMLHWIVAADLRGDGQPSVVRIDGRPSWAKIWPSGFRSRARNLWNYPLPPGVQPQPIEPIIAGQLTREGPGQWILPGPDGSIHILSADGKPLDKFNYGVDAARPGHGRDRRPAGAGRLVGQRAGGVEGGVGRCRNCLDLHCRNSRELTAPGYCLATLIAQYVPPQSPAPGRSRPRFAILAASRFALPKNTVQHIQEKRRFVMPITTESMAAWCRKLLGADPNAPRLTLEQYLAAIPRHGVPGQAAQRHARAGPRRRRRQAGRQGRRGRHPPAVDERHAQVRPGARLEADHLRPHRPRAGEVAGQGRRPAGRNPRLPGDVHRGLARSGHDDDQGRRGEDDRRQPRRAASSCCKTRGSTTSSGCCGRPSRPTSTSWPRSSPSWPTSSPQKVAKVYVHEAFSAGSLDASSVVVPAAMEKVALGKYEAEQFDGHLKECLNAQMVIFSGLKIDKLDDLAGDDRPRQDSQGDRGRLAGHGAEEGGRRAGRQAVRPGPVAKTRPTRTSPTTFRASGSSRRRRCSPRAAQKGIEFVMPVDFVLQDGQVSDDDRAGQSAVRRRPGLQRAVREDR